jgi:oligopeptidase B
LTLGGKPELLYQEKDELYGIGVGRTKDKKYVVLGIQSTDTWEMRYLDAATPSGDFKVVLPREKGHKYDMEHRDGLFYIRTNKEAKNFRVVTAPVSDPRPVNWKEFVPHKPDVLLEDLDVFKDYAVAHEKSEGLNRFRVLSFKTGTWHEVSFPETVYSAFGGGTPEFDTRMFRISYQSMITPSSVYDYDLETRERTLLKQQEVLGGYDAAQYSTERLWAMARDGVKVPISIVYKKGFNRDGQAPLWLYAYGSYGFGESATFSSDSLSLLDRGLAYAIAHIRGGDEMGEAWHDDGMLMKKKNTFTDFIDCAEYLIAQKWTSKDRLVIEGGSAGGLLMCAVTNMRPDLFKAVHSAVPFADVMNTMMDASLPLTVGEYLEWGNPNEKAAYDYMKTYSPYDNLEKKSYPAILVTTSFNDSQVMYWEPTKYVAKLRTLKTDKNELLLKCKMEPAGHGGASGR